MCNDNDCLIPNLRSQQLIFSPDDPEGSLARIFTLPVYEILKQRLILLPHQTLSLHLLQDEVLVFCFEESGQSVLQHDVDLVVSYV